jgi:hypothetical protein
LPESNKEERKKKKKMARSALHSCVGVLLDDNLIRTSISEKYDLATKITTHVKLPVTSQSKCVVIFVANSIGDPPYLSEILAAMKSSCASRERP